MNYIQNIKDFMSKTNMSITSLCKGIGIADSTLRGMLRGTVKLNLDTLIAIADYFAVPLDVLVGRCTQEQYDNILKDYNIRFMELRRAPYESYVIGRLKSKLLDHNFYIENPYESPYPYNLIEDATGEICDIVIEEDNEKGLEYSLSLLTDKQKEVMLLYYKDGKTYEQIGNLYNITREGIRQIINKALRTIRSPRCLHRIFYGYNAYNNKLKEIPIPTTDILDTSIMDMNLSNRSYNCLQKVSISNLRDIVKSYKNGDLKNIYSLGEKSYNEIIQASCEMLGVKDLASVK